MSFSSASGRLLPSIKAHDARPAGSQEIMGGKRSHGIIHGWNLEESRRVWTYTHGRLGPLHSTQSGLAQAPSNKGQALGFPGSSAKKGPPVEKDHGSMENITLLSETLCRQAGPSPTAAGATLCSVCASIRESQCSGEKLMMIQPLKRAWSLGAIVP
jgi:hypothetical protein